MKIATQNINGLQCKKNKLIEIFKQNDLDILCLQEIHNINSETINFIENRQSLLVSYKQLYKNYNEEFLWRSYLCGKKITWF